MSDHVILSIVAGVTIVNTAIIWKLAAEIDRVAKGR